MDKRKGLYELSTSQGIKVYNKNNEFIGTTTTFTAIAHNGGFDGGSIEIETAPDKFEWITGFGIYIVGMGIKIVD